MKVKILGRTVYERIEEVAAQPMLPAIVEPAQPTKPSLVSKGKAHAIKTVKAAAMYSAFAFMRFRSQFFTGEKNPGDVGPIVNYQVEHNALRMRSYQLYLESEICQLVLNKEIRWVIGPGLDIDVDPAEGVLKSEKITINAEDFSTAVEERWNVYADSEIPDYSGMTNLHELASDSFKNSILGGDVLVLLRLEDGEVTVQLIDGAHVQTPPTYASTGTSAVAPNGNRVQWGIEIDARGKHVAYHVMNEDGMKYDRIPAYSVDGAPVSAFMVYGLKYRLDNVRGIPLIAAVMETAKKMERYKEATLGTAEEQAKVAYSIEHEKGTDDSSPLNSIADDLLSNSGIDDAETENISSYELSQTVAAMMHATQNKQAYNLPEGASMKALGVGGSVLSFKDFYTVNIDLVCATIDIPPNVAMSKYDSNFSAARAALKDWEHTLRTIRRRFYKQFYSRVYEYWLYVQVLKNKISAPGYLEAVANRNRMALAAYNKVAFHGENVPHIDPLKEVDAEREKLGPMGQNMPLTTLEAAVRAVNSGRKSGAILRQFKRELQEAKDNGVYIFPLDMKPGAKKENQEEPENEYYS